MLNEIENAIVALLKGKLDQARAITVQKGVQGLTQPAIYASVELGSFELVGQARCKHSLTVYLDIVFSNLKDQQSRREGINLLLEGITQLLLLNNLGLDIHPLRPKGWRNITTEEADKLGLIAFTLELSTSYYIEILPEEDITDLLTIGLNYYLQDPADDGLVDAVDEVTL